MNIIPRSHLRVLVLDDEPERVECFRDGLDDGHSSTVVHCPSAPAAQHNLKNARFDFCFFDHDLELSAMHWGISNHGNGADVVDWLCRLGPHRWSETRFIIHSLNRNGGRYMVEKLRHHGFCASRRAYAWTDLSDLRSLARNRHWPDDKERWDLSFPVTSAVKA